MSVMCLDSPARIPRANRWRSYIGTFREVIEMLLEDGEPQLDAEFVGTQSITVPA